MNATNKYLDAVKAKTGAPSDYALAAILGITKQQISKYRNKGEYLGDGACMEAARILEIDPLIILAEIQAEKAKSEPAKAVWKQLYEKLGGMAAAVTLGIMLSAPTPSSASTGAGYQSAKQPSDLYIIRNGRGRKRRKGGLTMLLQNLLPSPNFA